MSDYPDIKLTPENEKYILEVWDKVSLIEMVKEITGDPAADGRHKMGHVIKEFLAAKGFKPKTSKYEKVEAIELTIEQKEFIKTNISKLKSLEATRVLFKNDKLSPLSKEFRIVNKYYKEIDQDGINRVQYQSDNEESVDEDYKSPTSIVRLIPRVNQYVTNQKDETAPLFKTNEPEKLTTQDEKSLRALLRYMQVPRFAYQVNQYNRKIDREIFESTFIRYTLDKPDLLQEEIDRYISLCAEIVTTSQIDRNIQKIEQYINEMMDGTDDQRRISVSMIENINGLRERLNKSQEMQKKLYNELTGSRSARLRNKLNANASVLNLVEAWQDEKKRKEMIEIAKLQKLAESEDINKLESMEDVVALIYGLSKEEAILSQ